MKLLEKGGQWFWNYVGTLGHRARFAAPATSCIGIVTLCVLCATVSKHKSLLWSCSSSVHVYVLTEQLFFCFYIVLRDTAAGYIISHVAYAAASDSHCLQH